MIASDQITNIEIFAFIAVLVFKLLSCKILFTNRKESEKKRKFQDTFETFSDYLPELFQFA